MPTIPNGLIPVGTAAHALSADAFDAASAAFAGISQRQVTVLLDPRDRPLQAVWTRLPSHIAVFACSVDALPLVVARELEEEVRRFENNNTALWQWLIDAASQSDRVVAITAGCELPADILAGCQPTLAPQRPGGDQHWLLERLASVSLPGGSQSPDSSAGVAALRAGLLQLHDFLEESHQLSQSIEGRGPNRNGDYWHGVMHRREPDDSNAKYWFRRVGPHPVFAPLAEEAAAILADCSEPRAEAWIDRLTAASKWDPFAFVDLCSHCRSSADDTLTKAARRIQLAEMLLLLVQTYDDAADR